MKLKNYIDSLIVENNILVPRRTKDERDKNYQRIVNKQIEKYIKDGMLGNLDLTKSAIKVFNPKGLTKVGKHLSLYSCENLSEFSPPDLTIINGDLSLSFCYDLIKFNPLKLKKILGSVYLFDTPFIKQFNDRVECREYFLDKFGLTINGDVYI